MGIRPKRSGSAGTRTLRRRSELERIALLPEMAIARVGSSDEPLACYDWKEPDNSPGGSGKTGLESKPTLRISEKGEIELEPPGPIGPRQHEPGRLIPPRALKRPPVQFTEPIENGRNQRFRPVCPWFVLAAKWRGREWDVLLPQDLEDIGVPVTGVSWHVVVANRKAYNMTLALEDVIYAEAAIGGDQNDGYGDAPKGLIERSLVGRSDAEYWRKYSGFPYKSLKFDDGKRLIPKKEGGFHLGRIQAPLFSDKYGIRLRFVPPAGAVYGPSDLRQRIDSLVGQLPDDQRTDLLENWDNWYKLKIEWNQEQRTTPWLQFAYIAVPGDSGRTTYHSLGLIDDFSDGIVTVKLNTDAGVTHTAQARVVVGPSDLAPDRRHPVRLYETFADRAYLGGGESYDGPPDKLSDEDLRKEVADLFRRAYETVGLINVDAMNHRLKQPFSKEMQQTVPGSRALTQLAGDKHRRLASPETLEDILREQPQRKDTRRVILDPGPDNDKEGLLNLPPDDSGEVPKANAFNRMPALMRGSNFGPLHLTRRQIEALRRWLSALRSSGS